MLTSFVLGDVGDIVLDNKNQRIGFDFQGIGVSINRDRFLDDNERVKKWINPLTIKDL
jgi:hypothetical protein